MAKQCKITYKGKEYNEDDFNFIVLNSMLNSIKDKNNNFDDTDSNIDLYQAPFSENNNELSDEQNKAINDLFESNPELKSVFNNDTQLYQQYLNSIFPNSQIKNVVYHGTRTQDRFEEFDENKIGELDSGYFGKGFYFSPDLDYANGYSKLYDGYNIAAIVDLQNPLETDANKANSGVSLSNNDGAIVRVGENLLPSLNTVESDPNEIGEIVVKSAKQIHILGSKKDIMMAKKFVENTSEKSSTLNLSTLGITQEEFNQLTKQEQEQLTKCYV
jgi:hypothetical protein